MKIIFLLKMLMISFLVLAILSAYADLIVDDDNNILRNRDTQLEELVTEDESLPSKDLEIPEDSSSERRLAVALGSISLLAGLSVLVWIRRKSKHSPNGSNRIVSRFMWNELS